MWSEEKQKEHQIEQAQAELTQCFALKILLSNNTIAAGIEISGMSIGICDNSWLIPAVDKQIEELKKAIEGEPNLWE